MVRGKFTAISALAIAATVTATVVLAIQPVSAHKEGPLVLAHRGASGYRPENTLEAYRLAIMQDTDYVETDVVSTKDGVLIARGDNEISATTDVAKHPEYADRKTTKAVDGLSVTGWFTEDFTYAEITTLRAIERLPLLRPANTAYNGQFTIPTLAETLSFVRAQNRHQRKHAGVYIELKHPSYFRGLGLALEEPVARALRHAGLDNRRARVFLQSFEPSSLQRLKQLTGLRTVQGLDVAGRPYDFTAAGDTRTYADLITPAGLAWIRSYADAVGANASLVIPRDATGHLLAPTTLVADAHAAWLGVHAWTFRAENTFLPADFRIGTDPAVHGDLTGALKTFYGQQVDAVFCEFPDIATAARA